MAERASNVFAGAVMALAFGARILALSRGAADAPCLFARIDMPHNSGVTERLAQFVVETRWDALQPPVVHAAECSLMNFFAVALTGCR